MRQLAPEADAAVIAASWQDSDRFSLLYDRYATQLYRYAYRRVGAETADDVVAETFLAAFQRRRNYDLTRPDARPWLFGILTRELARHRRAERAHFRAVSRTVAETSVDSPAERVTERVSADRAASALAASLADLSAGDRHALLLVAWADFSYEEVAAALGIPMGTVGSRLNRARRKVREALGGVNPTESVERHK